MVEQFQEIPNATDASPELIIRIATAFMAAKHLFAAVEVGLFEALAERPATLDMLTKRLGMPRRTARISADAMVALGLLERDEDGYRNGPVAGAFLAGATPTDLRPAVRLFRLRYGGWAEFETAIRSGGQPGFVTQMNDEDQRIFSEGVEAITTGTAHALAEVYEFERHKRLLDLGGGTGSFLIPIVARQPQIHCALFEIPAVAALARQRLADRSLAGQVSVLEGDLLRDPVPEGYDAFLVANVVHVFSPEQNRDLFGRIHEHAREGSRLLLVDFWTDPNHTEPVFAAVMAGEFLLAGGDGDVYSEEEVRDWLDTTGWAALDRRPLAGPASLIIAERL